MSTQRTVGSASLTDLLFDEAAVGLCLVAPDGTIVRVNAPWLRSTGFQHEQVLGEHIVSLFPGTRDMALAMHARARAGHRVEVPRHAQTVNGRETWWEGSIAPVAMEGGTGLLITAREVRSGAGEQPAGCASCTEIVDRLLACVPEGITIATGPEVVTIANSRYAEERLLGSWNRSVGLSMEQWLARVEHYLPDGKTPAAVEDLPLWRATRRGESVRDAELVVRRPDGTRMSVTCNAEPVRDAAGDVVGGIVAWRDVTEQRRQQAALRTTEERFRLLAEAMPQIVCVLAPDGAVELVNRAWTAFSGLDVAATARTGWERVLHPDDVQAARECRHLALKRLEPQDVELRYRAADGTYRWFLSRLAPVVEGGRVVRFIGAGMDIERRKRAEAELRDANAKLVEADRRKDEFLGMLSHELRNPLAPIRNSSFILRHATPGSDAASRAQQVIERQTGHLTHLVDDLLDVTRISRGKIELRRSAVDLREVVLRAAEDFRLPLDDRGVSFRASVPEAPVRALVDATRITQVVGNLLTNAAKFTRRGDEVMVSLTVEGGEAAIRVRDTGAGIDPAIASSIFQPFVQGERTLARSEGGLGLGLALVRGIAELHGGAASVTSEGKGRGAEFLVRLPLGQGQPSAPADGRSAGTARSGRRVLVVDDNVDAAETLAEIVTLLGHTAEIAFDGPGALDKVRSGRPDVVLCDLGLPGMSGYDVAAAIRAMAGERVQLVAVSGYAQPEDVKRAMDAGFDAHVAKPADLTFLEALLA
ncbi:PAS/PAC sensor hybrid histidine kinase [Anaeromyxobacter sp. K]|uniref:PAS domain S-box protein n=1 Tax=Anaeromyxobacter sp. (strain K) TaxID=447217 RepID=UPI00015F9F3D|nr:PAS domain S-box protein [Anaeromyxobacter sp. K]ACG73623.1 PAS/PAC sensor hybrid histidine kinase [Anaeromyxobacter sp. K]